jgi:hypothetical protein
MSRLYYLYFVGVSSLSLLLIACDSSSGASSSSDASITDATAPSESMDSEDLDLALSPSMELDLSPQDEAERRCEDSPVVAFYQSASGVESIARFLRGEGDDLTALTQEFYLTYPDRYDFIYLIADVPEGNGRYTRVRTPARPEIGLTNSAESLEYGSPERLKGVVALNLKNGNGPTLHETLHHWGMFLDQRLGFGGEWGPHWGPTSVNGQHGGFDRSTLRCSAPEGETLLCDRNAEGLMEVSTAPFSPNANGGDAVPYAPLELYLMGLLDAEEVEEEFLILEQTTFLGEANDRLQFTTSNIRTVTMDEILSTQGGTRPLLSEEERAFRGAFIFVSAEEPSATQREMVQTWAHIFGGEVEHPRLFSFQRATGERASMNVRLCDPR